MNQLLSRLNCVACLLSQILKNQNSYREILVPLITSIAGGLFSIFVASMMIRFHKSQHSNEYMPLLNISQVIPKHNENGKLLSLNENCIVLLVREKKRIEVFFTNYFYLHFITFNHYDEFFSTKDTHIIDPEGNRREIKKNIDEALVFHLQNLGKGPAVDINFRIEGHDNSKQDSFFSIASENESNILIAFEALSGIKKTYKINFIYRDNSNNWYSQVLVDELIKQSDGSWSQLPRFERSVKIKRPTF